MKGDLIVGLGGDLVEGDLIGGFGIGNADVPIWGGVNGVGTLSLPEVPGVPRGPSPVYHCLLVVSRNPSGSSCHTVPFGVSPLLSGPLSQLSTAPHGDASAIRSTPLLALFSSQLVSFFVLSSCISLTVLCTQSSVFSPQSSALR